MQERKRNEKKRTKSLLRVTALVIPMVLLLLLSQTAIRSCSTRPLLPIPRQF